MSRQRSEQRSIRPARDFCRAHLESIRVRKVVSELGVAMDFRDVMLSPRHRRQLDEMASQARLPCLLLGGTVVDETDEIIKYLRLRYGRE